jgi:putative ABC transport system permease protein
MMARLRSLLRNLFRRNRVERTLDDELQASVQILIRQRVARGLSLGEARRQALAELGGVEPVREQVRSARTGALFDALRAGSLWRDFVVGARRLRATPAFTIFAVASLALGVGATTAVYSAIHSLLWRSTGVQGPDRVVLLVRSSPSGGRASVTQQDWDALRSATVCCDGIAASTGVAITLANGSWNETFTGEAVTGEYFGVLGVRAALGRVVVGPDDDPASPPVAVLSHQLWRTRLMADPAVIGRLVPLNGQPVRVVGVLPASFTGLGRFAGVDIWIPASALPSEHRSRFTIVGRLRADRNVTHAANEFAAAGRSLDALLAPEASGPAQKSLRQWSAVSYADAMRDPPGGLPLGAIVMGLVGLVVAVASANLANLVLGRGASRRQELAVRRALGASRWRLVREQLAESVILVVLGAAGAYVVVRGLLVALAVELRVSPTQIVQLEPELNLPALATAAAALLLSLIVIGLLPAWQLTRQDARPLMTSDPGGIGHRWWRGQTRSVTWQVAMSLGLLLVAVSCIRVVADVARHDSGVDVGRLVIGYLSKPRDWSSERTRLAFDRLLATVTTQPGIEEAAVSSGLPFGTQAPAVSVTTADRPFGAGANDINATLVAATPGIFRVAGIAILRGRAFDENDRAPVVVLSAQTAQRLFGTIDVVGRAMRLRDWPSKPDRPDRAGRSVDIIGIASDTDTSRLFSRKQGAVYVPLGQHSESAFMYLTLVARASDDPGAVMSRLHVATALADPDLAIGPGSGSGRMVLAGAYEGLRVLAILLGSLGALAVVLSMAGLYGVLSHATARRTREIGLRMALGASRDRVLRLVLTEGLKPVFEGVVIGLVIATAVRVILHNVTEGAIAPVGMVTSALACLPLAFAAVVACYLPARRAARIQPSQALKEQ